jgi:hypothetical protein
MVVWLAAGWQPRDMARAAVVLCALVGVACAENPYVIGRAEDGGPSATDAGVPDAGVRDAGADAGVDAGQDECAGEHAGALVCSGFEAPELLDEWDETSLMESGALERTTARAHRGQAALRASSASMMSVAVVSKRVGPVRSGELYVRLYLYVADGLPTRTMNIMFVGDFPMPDPFVGIDFNLATGGELQVFSPQGNPVRQTGSLTVPRDRWFCLRARIAVSDDAGFVQLFVDDVLALDATGIDTLPDAGIRELRAGIDWSSEQDDFFELYLDDIVLATSPVACD